MDRRKLPLYIRTTTGPKGGHGGTLPVWTGVGERGEKGEKRGKGEKGEKGKGKGKGKEKEKERERKGKGKGKGKGKEKGVWGHFPPKSHFPTSPVHPLDSQK